MKPVTDETIRRMVRRIVRRFKPERIILFGSRARRDAHPDSDVDLLVVMPVQGSRREKRLEIGMALSNYHISVDVVVVTPHEFKTDGGIPGTIVRPALREGKVLYFALDSRKKEVLRQWVQKAENDLLSAAQVLKLGKRCPADTVCFHGEQCVETYLKALLVNHELDFPKTHSIAKLVGLLPASARPSLSHDEQLRLTEYATVIPYPGDYDPPTVSDARAAVKLARRVRAHARKRLPKAALK